MYRVLKVYHSFYKFCNLTTVVCVILLLTKVTRYIEGEKQDDLCKLQGQVQEGTRWYPNRAASN